MRILLISDVHANIDALQALDERYDQLLCLGDLVDYGPSPREALQFLRERAPRIVRGNHDTAVGLSGRLPVRPTGISRSPPARICGRSSRRDHRR